MAAVELDSMCENYPGSVHHSRKRPRHSWHHEAVVLGLLQAGYVPAIGQLIVYVRGD
jgi:hypothetical protein